MKITRRFFFSFLLIPFLAATSLGDPGPTHTYLVFVGTYTDKTDSKGIYAYDFDPSMGQLTPRGLAIATSNPSWLAIHPNGKWLYAANESGKQSTISAFSVDGKTAKLTLLNQLPAQGEDPCYLSFDKTGKYLFVANYTSGNVVVFPILADGKLGVPTANVKDQGALGLNKERQDGPHAHWVAVSPGNGTLYVSDLGLDRVFVYTFNATNGSIGLDKAWNSWTPVVSPGTGPRHVAVLGLGEFVYVLGELKSTVTVLKNPGVDRDSIHFVQRISTLPPGFTGRNDAAEIAIHPSGKWLFASNRGHDSIAVFAIDPQKGTLTPAGDFPTGGKEPRHFALDPTGQFLLAENQNSNSIVVFRINPATGALTQVSALDGVPSPVCLLFVRIL